MATKTTKTTKTNNENSFPQQIFARLDKFLKERGDAYVDLARNVFVSKGYFASMKATKGAIGSEVLAKICLFYSELNADWLLTGRGEMLRSAAMLKKESALRAKELNKKIRVVNKMLATVHSIEKEAALLSAQAEELR